MFKNLIKTLVVIAIITTTSNIAYSQPPWDPNDILNTQLQYVGWSSAEKMNLMAEYADGSFDIGAITTVPNDDCSNTKPSECTGNMSIWKTNGKAVVQHPNWAGCKIEVSYQYRYCLGNIRIVQLRITSKKIPSSGCTSLLNYLNGTATNSLSPEVQAEREAQLENDLYGLLGKYIFLEFIKNYSPVYCGSSQEHVKIEYTKGACGAFCRAIVPDGKGGTKKISTPISCIDNTYCCKFKYIYCINPEDQSLSISTFKETGQHPACPYYPTDPQCEGGVSADYTPCVESCNVEFMDLED